MTRAGLGIWVRLFQLSQVHIVLHSRHRVGLTHIITERNIRFEKRGYRCQTNDFKRYINAGQGARYMTGRDRKLENGGCPWMDTEGDRPGCLATVAEHLLYNIHVTLSFPSYFGLSLKDNAKKMAIKRDGGTPSKIMIGCF